MLIVYRACSTGYNKQRPIEKKSTLVKTCFDSFRKAFEDVDYDLVVLLDKPNKAFRHMFRFVPTQETFYPSLNEGNILSFYKQIDLVLKDKQNYLFVEDDYYFLPNSGKILEEAVNTFDFVTPYDHPGYYTEEEHNYKREIKIVGDHHWQTVSSTTLTFGGSWKALEQEVKTMKKYSIADHYMWLDVTDRHKLWSPIPSLATHMENPHLAPNIEWQFENLK